MLPVALLATHIRAEEKLLVAALRELGVEPEIILDRDLNFDLTAGPEQLAPSGITLEDLRNSPRGIFVKRKELSPEPEYRRYATLFKGLPHGKVQCYNEFIGGKDNSPAALSEIIGIDAVTDIKRLFLLSHPLQAPIIGRFGWG